MVVRGNTLSKIAKQFYGNASDYRRDWMRIFEAIRPMLAHPDKIDPGQNLRVPPTQTPASSVLPPGRGSSGRVPIIPAFAPDRLAHSAGSRYGAPLLVPVGAFMAKPCRCPNPSAAG